MQRFVAGAVAVLVLASGALGAQVRPSGVASQAAYKGVFEPVSFSEDIDFHQVYFVTADLGWVSGEHGTIIRTTDGGKTWEAQLGGDPADKSESVRALHFLDERRGWAVQERKLLRTTDGENWEEIGTIPVNVSYLAFTSPRVGFLGGSEGHSVNGAEGIYKTTDGGRTWKPVWKCQAKISIGGLSQNHACVVGMLHFPTAQVGYAALNRGCQGVGCGGPSLIAKTADGGNTWQILNGPGNFETDEVAGVRFIDENTGFARTFSRKLHMTTDGGQTWRGIPVNGSADMRFADPSVGWGIELGWTDLRWSFTTDGGRRWSSREMKLPAQIWGFSLPRRDRAFIVGDHGMIFRYRVVPTSAPIGPNVVVGAAMPAYETPLDEQVAQLETVIKDMSTELEAFTPPAASGGVTPAGAPFNVDSASAADSVAAWNEPVEAPLPPATGYTANCCKKSFSRLELTLGLISQSLPQFVAQYKNLNLLLVAMRMSSELPGDYRNLKGGLRTFRTAQDKESAKAALAEVLAALKALKQTTAESMQQVLPPVPSPTGSDDAAFSASASPGSASNASSSSADAQSKAKPAAKNEKKEAVKEAAKKGLGGLLKRRP